MCSRFILLLLCAILPQTTSAGGVSAATLEVTNQYQHEMAPRGINLRCVPVTGGHCDKSVVLMQVFKNEGTEIASIRGRDLITYGHLMKTSVKAEGHIDQDLDKTFFSVTLLDVVKEDSGVYSCSILFLDGSSHRIEEMVSANVTVDEVHLQHVVRHLMARVSLVDNVLTFENNATKTLLIKKDKEVRDTMFAMMDKLTSLETTVQNQQKQLSEQMRTIQKTNRYVQKDQLTSAFSAGYGSGNVKLSAGHVLRFPKVRENIGGGYNAATGVYTAPVDGVYAFHFYGMGSGSGLRDMQLDINAKGLRAATLLVDDTVRWDQSSVSCVVILKAGETVKCVVHYAGDTSVLFDSPYSGFTGHLIKAL